MSKISIIQQALNNFFNCSQGSIFFKPEVYSTLEDSHFEDITDWVKQNQIQSSIVTSLADHFPALELVHNGLKFIYKSKTNELDLQIRVRIVDLDTEEDFQVNLYKGVHNG